MMLAAIRRDEGYAAFVNGDDEAAHAAFVEADVLIDPAFDIPDDPRDFLNYSIPDPLDDLS